MSKVILITIIVVLLVVVMLGIYFMFGNSNKSLFPGSQNANNFEIQGMKVEILKQGSGEGAKAGDYITLHYIGTLEDGKEFDSSINRNAPFVFQLGQSRVIKGMDLGLVGMKVGEKKKLTIPPELAYGLDGFPPLIPKKATLIYIVDLLKKGSTPHF